MLDRLEDDPKAPTIIFAFERNKADEVKSHLEKEIQRLGLNVKVGLYVGQNSHGKKVNMTDAERTEVYACGGRSRSRDLCVMIRW